MPTQRDERIEAARHGVDCVKVPHQGRDGYLHGEDHDFPYDCGGVTYCGRCHAWIGSPVKPRAASSVQRPVDAKDADALWEKFERYVDAESWTTPRCKRALSRVVQEARAEERERAAKLCRDKGDKYEDERDALPRSPAADTLNAKAIACWECEEEIRGTVEGG